MPVEVPGTIYGAGFCAPPEQASTFGISELNLCGHCGSAATTCPGLEGSEIRKDRHGYFLMFCTREASNLTLGDQGAVSDGVLSSRRSRLERRAFKACLRGFLVEYV